MDPLQPDHARPQPVDRRRVRRRGAPLGMERHPGPRAGDSHLATVRRRSGVLRIGLVPATGRDGWPDPVRGAGQRPLGLELRGRAGMRRGGAVPARRRMAGVRHGRAGVLAAGEPPVVCGELAAAAAGRIVAWAACSARSVGTAGAACAIAIYAAADVHEHGHHCKHARHARPADAAADVSRAFRLPAVRASRPIAIPDVSAAGEPACSVCRGQCAADLHRSADGGGAAVETRPPQAGRTAAGTGDAWLGIAGDRRIWLVRHYDAG